MTAPLITAQNVDALCGKPGAAYHEFGGHRRILNAVFEPGCDGVMYSRPFRASDLIPREEWPDRIAQKDREKSWPDDLMREMGVDPKDQDGTRLCHGYCVAAGMEEAYAIQGVRKKLSAESITGRMNGWKNAGGDPEKDLDVAIRLGACEESFMDRPYSLSHKLWKEGWEENALLHRVVEFERGFAKRFDVEMTCALNNWPCPKWLAWWRHAFLGGLRGRRNPKTKRYEIMCLNNWGSDWGDNGRAWFEEGTKRGQGTPTGIVVVRVVTPIAA